MRVDQGEILCKFSSIIPSNEIIIEVITDRLCLPASLILLYNSEGFIIDLSSIPKIPDNSQIYSFRRDSINKSSFISHKP